MLTDKHFKKAALATAVSMLPMTSFAAATLEEIVVTAQKREQRLQDVPISLDVLGAQEINSKAIADTQDLALASPSLTLQSGFGPTSYNIAIRGIGTIALEGGIQPSISFVVDGVPLGRISEFVADLGDVERVEILRGPQGTLYGRNATGGAINLVRAGPSEEFAGYVEGTVEEDAYVARAMLNGALSDTVQGRVSVYHKETDPYVTNYYPGADDLGGEETSAILAKLNFQLSDSASLLITGEYRDTTSNEGFQLLKEAEGPGQGELFPGYGALRIRGYGNGDAALGAQLIDDPFAGNLSTPTEHDIENWGLAADLTIEINDDLVFKSITSARDYESASVTDFDAGPALGTDNPFNMQAGGIINTSYGKDGTGGTGPGIYNLSDDFTQEFRLEGTTDSMEWIGGIFYALHEDHSIADTPVVIAPIYTGGVGPMLVFSPRDGGAEFESWAAFGDMTMDIAEDIQFFAGLRWTMEDVDVRNDRQGYRAFPLFGGTTFSDDLNYAQVTTDPQFIDLTGDGIPDIGQVVQTDNVVYEDTDRSEDWSGRIGFKWDATERTSAYISASKGFVGAGANFSRQGTAANPFIEPSVTYAYELGFKSRLFDDSVSLNAALFHQEVNDLQTTQLIPGTILSDIFNAGQLTSQGLELNVTWAATDLLTLDLAATLQDTELDDLTQPCYTGQTFAQGCAIDNNNDGTFDAQDISGKKMVQAPDLSYNLSARLDIPTNDMPFDAYVIVDYNYTDDVQHQLYHDPRTVVDSYSIVNAFVGIEDKAGRYQVSIYGKNLGDEYYDASLSVATGSQGRLLGRTPRTAQTIFGIKARYNF